MASYFKCYQKHNINLSEQSAYTGIKTPVHAINNQSCKVILDGLQLTADQPASQYLNIGICRLPLVQRQTTKQKVRNLTHKHIIICSNFDTFTSTNSFWWQRRNTPPPAESHNSGLVQKSISTAASVIFWDVGVYIDTDS